MESVNGGPVLRPVRGLSEEKEFSVPPERETQDGLTRRSQRES